MNLIKNKHILYRRNNYGQPCMWSIEYLKQTSMLVVQHGIVGKTITTEYIIATRGIDEVESKVKSKRKIGYKYIDELKDNVEFPVENDNDILQYLQTYLPYNRTTDDNTLLPMLAKTYDNKNNKLYKNSYSAWIGQYKINGLRCLISAKYNTGDLFKPYKLIFQSREGTYWTSLSNLEEYLIDCLGGSYLNRMIDEHIILDGELYLPGYSVNEINHFVKDPTCAQNKLIQYWCYDLAIEEALQTNRLIQLIHDVPGCKNINISTKEEHLNIKDRFIILPSITIENHEEAINARNKFIDLGFEGLIMRDLHAEYQFGKRNSSMIKFKRSTDGIFVIQDIIPEGLKRSDIPLFVCKNDINDALFEVHLSSSLDIQRYILKNKSAYIGKKLLIEFGERSGVNSVPFHVKNVSFKS